MRAILVSAVLLLTSIGGAACHACGDAPASAPHQEQYVPQPGPNQRTPLVLASMGFGGGAVAGAIALTLFWRRKA